MTAGISLPCPIYKYTRGELCTNCGVLFGLTGFTVGRHVHLHLQPGPIICLAWFMKIFCMVGFVILQFYIEKGYLKFAHTQGISRLQLQHPVHSCNPLTQAEGGCAVNFTEAKDLPYCKQYTGPARDGFRPEKCEYFDEFDVQLPGYQQNSLMIPTRRTKYVQNVACSKDSGQPCPAKDKLKAVETIFVADIEDFTLLIDHSFVSDELHLEMTAWEMLGFVNPCGRGADLGGEIKLLDKTKEMLHEVLPGQSAVAKECRKQEFQPIHRPLSGLNKEEKANIHHRMKGFAMWMSDWTETFLPFILSPDPEKKAYEMVAPFHKIHNGDIIRLGDLFELAGFSLDDPAEGKTYSRRFDGVVIIIDIYYTNWKEYSWPNRFEPAYFYSFSVAPASEFKIMQQAHTQTKIASHDKHGNREIYDYHGVYIMVKQGGQLGSLSYQHLFLLFLGVIFIESIYRSLFLCLILNCDLDKGMGAKAAKKKKRDGGAEEEEQLLEMMELDEYVTKDFHLHGRGKEREGAE